jgi:hypothetical protein
MIAIYAWAIADLLLQILAMEAYNKVIESKVCGCGLCIIKPCAMAL